MMLTARLCCCWFFTISLISCSMLTSSPSCRRMLFIECCHLIGLMFSCAVGRLNAERSRVVRHDRLVADFDGFLQLLLERLRRKVARLVSGGVEVRNVSRQHTVPSFGEVHHLLEHR